MDNKDIFEEDQKNIDGIGIIFVYCICVLGRACPNFLKFSVSW